MILHGVAGINETLCASHRQKSVLFDTQVSQTIKISTIPSKMCVSIAQA